jgi:hypothetical protein
MSVLNLRGVPEELVRSLKVRAAQRGVSLREYCVECLRREVGIVLGVAADESKVGSPRLHIGTGAGKRYAVRSRKVVKREDVGNMPEVANGDEVVGSISVKCPKPGHVSFRNGDSFYCSTCQWRRV